MASVVFILGAGASREGGAPLMSDFLEVARRLPRVEELGPYRDPFEVVFRGISALQQVHSKANLDIGNLESVFAAFDMARLLNAMPDHDAREISELVPAIKKLIYRTLELRLQFPIGREVVDPPRPYNQFCALVKAISERTIPEESVSVITFNYDLALDFGFANWGMGPQYGLSAQQRPTGIKLLKLHGSLNWGRCEKCKRTIPCEMEEYIRKRLSWKQGEEYVRVEVASNLQTYRHCSHLEADPVLVPPTWNKTESASDLREVWQVAAGELKDAEHVFIIGYSLPDTDQFFRSLFALGTVGPNLFQRLWVFNPDDTGVVKSRFESLLGAAARSRFQYFREPFNHAIQQIERAFKFRS